MSSLPSPLKSPTSGTSVPAANQSCHFAPPPKPAPLESATQTSAVEPRVNAIRSCLPSPLKSPVAHTSSPTQNQSWRALAMPKRLPSDAATNTSPPPPYRRASPATSPVDSWPALFQVGLQ
jgi:hypothetical protein